MKPDRAPACRFSTQVLKRIYLKKEREMSQEDMDEMRKIRRTLEERRKKEATAEEPAKSVKKHVVESGETLSHIALKYYGSATKEKWMIIYEANKDVIGDDPNKIRPGQEFVIPEIE
jgi:hypothetical protein